MVQAAHEEAESLGEELRRQGEEMREREARAREKEEEMAELLKAVDTLRRKVSTLLSLPLSPHHSLCLSHGSQATALHRAPPHLPLTTLTPHTPPQWHNSHTVHTHPKFP